MRLDCATTLVDRSLFPAGWTQEHMQRDFTADDLWRILVRNRYEGCLVTAHSATERETRWLLEQASRHPWIRGVIGAPLPGVCAVRIRWQPELSLPPMATPIDLMLEVDQLEPAAASLPDVPLALVNNAGARYLPGEFALWAKGIDAMARHPHVVVKLSGLINNAPGSWAAATYRPYVQHALAAFGADRVMYGSDWPYCMQTGTWKESMAAFTQALGAQPQDVRDRILGGNATRFYRLPG